MVLAELAEVEKRLEALEIETLRTSYIKSKPIYEDRARLIEQIPGFWSKVLQSDDVPPAIESCIYACDIPALDLLTAIEVTRFEVDGDPERGDPRSFRIKFEFDHNGFLADRVLEKTFWYRSDQDGRAGLVSGPVEIRFSQMPQGNPLAQGSAKMESFFAFLRYGGRKDTADEPPKYAEDLLEAKDGSSDSSMPKVEQGSDSDLESLLKRTVSPDDDDDDSLAHEIFPLGEDIAIAISEDLYPGALKYFAHASEQEMSESDDEEVDEADDGKSGVSLEMNEQPSKRRRKSRKK